ncbi:hypothetical protein [Actinokineospora inagensis]|uniref:hypothetical protein n=1 Tax=Actinokineospora inagensis TaxID=103730 RepID=UPI0004217E1D|nr:hypothetical protein [Actinokineospora inagensis]
MRVWSGSWLVGGAVVVLVVGGILAVDTLSPTGCPAPSGPLPAVTEIDGTGPLVPAATPVSVQLCPGTDDAPAHWSDPAEWNTARVVTAINSLRAANPRSACPAIRGPRFDLVLNYADQRVVLQVNTSGCGTVHRDGHFRHGGRQLVDLVKDL